MLDTQMPVSMKVHFTTPFTTVPQRNESIAASTASGDVVNIHTPQPLTDNEAELSMQSVRQAAEESPAELLAAHQGLQFSTVMSLLEDI